MILGLPLLRLDFEGLCGHVPGATGHKDWSFHVACDSVVQGFRETGRSGESVLTGEVFG